MVGSRGGIKIACGKDLVENKMASIKIGFKIKMARIKIGYKIKMARVQRPPGG